MPAKILIVDDEPGIRKLIHAYLKNEGYTLQEAADGLTALEIAFTFQPDVIILDIMLPGLDGLEVLTQLRRESNAYVILLTAKTEEMDKIIGLSVGADDYVTKPFSPRELLARVKAALRRINGQNNEPSVLTTNHLELDPTSRQVFLEGEPLELTLVEFNVLQNLMEHPGQVLSREQILENVWGHQYYGETRVVDVHVGHIRQKLGNRFIETVRGIGYRFKDQES